MKALILLGGGLKKDGCLTPWAEERVKLAAALFDSGDYEFIVACGKGRSGLADDISEAKVMVDELLSLGIERNHLHLEDASTNTIENAYFSCRDFVDPRGVRHITVVTNRFHAKRAKKIFQLVYGYDYELLVEEAPNGIENLDDLEVLERCDSEQAIFFNQHIQPLIIPGSMRDIKDFIYNPENTGRAAWEQYKKTNPVYQLSSRLMVDYT